MSLALDLYPIDYLGSNWGFSHTVLTLPGGGGVRGVLKESGLKPRLLPDDHKITGRVVGRVPDGYAEGESMHGRFDTDPYGDPYTWLTASELLPVLQQCHPKHPTTAYIAALEPNTLVVLGWH